MRPGSLFWHDNFWPSYGTKELRCFAKAPTKRGIDRNAENMCDPECRLERRRIFTGFDRCDRLARHADTAVQFLLRHLAVRETQEPYAVRNRSGDHAWRR